MYLPKSFIMDAEAAADTLRDHAFATLVSRDGETLVASHIPMVYDAEGHRLLAHLARANPQWRSWVEQEVLVIFQGVHGYISPSWYVNQPAVPTWNYEAVHVYGVPKVIDEPDVVFGILSDLCEQYDPAYAEHFREELDPEWRANMMKAIIAFEIPISRLEAKLKMNQNRGVEDVIGVIEALTERGQVALADRMRLANAGRTK